VTGLVFPMSSYASSKELPADQLCAGSEADLRDALE
jgi:hypothetical protein